LVKVLSDGVTQSANEKFSIYINDFLNQFANLTIGGSTNKNIINNTSNVGMYLVDVDDTKFQAGSKMADLTR